MWNETTEGREFIKDISRQVVVQTAPEELDLFDELSQEYYQNPQPPRRAANARDDELSFGLEDTLIAITPVAMAMASTVMTFLVGQVVKAGKEESANLIQKKIKALFNPQPTPQGPPPLTREQLQQVQELARGVAIQYGVKANQADKMATALVGSLALAG